jgi:hypothetical protein
MKPWTKSALATIVIILAFFLLLSAIFGSIDPRQWSSAPAGGTDGTPTYPGTTLTNLQITIIDAGKNTLDSSAALTDDSNYYVTYWTKTTDNNYRLLGTGASGTCTVEVPANNIIYVCVEPRSGQAYYVDKDATRTNNPRMSAASYFDIDNDGYKEFVFPLSVANVEKPIGSLATLYIYPYFIAYTAPSISTPSDISSIGEAASTQWIEWYLSFGSTKKGFAIVKVELAFNTTDATKLTFTSMNIPGVGYVSGDQFELQRGSSTLTYVYDVDPYNLDGAIYLKYGINQLNKFDFTTRLDTNLATSDVLTATINIYGLNQTATAVSVITDSVTLSE